MVNLRNHRKRSSRPTLSTPSNQPASPKKRPKISTSNCRASASSNSKSKAEGPKNVKDRPPSPSSSSSSGEDSDDSDAYVPGTKKFKKLRRKIPSEPEPPSRSPSPKPKKLKKPSKPSSSSSTKPSTSKKYAKPSISTASATSTSNSKSVPLNLSVSSNNQVPKRKMIRVPSNEQITKIKELFENKQFPSYAVMIELGKTIGMNRLQVHHIVSKLRSEVYERFISNGLIAQLPCQMRALEEEYQRNRGTDDAAVHIMAKDLKMHWNQILTYFEQRRVSDRAAGKKIPEFKFSSKHKKYEIRGVTVPVKKVLMARFEVNKNPTDDELEEMMESTGLTKRKLKFWFAARNNLEDHEVPPPAMKRIEKRVPLPRKTFRLLMFHFKDGEMPSLSTRAKIAQKAKLTKDRVYLWYLYRTVKKDPADLLKIRNILMKYYTDVGKNPSKLECEELAKKTETTLAYITNWFMRERFQERRRNGQMDDDSGGEADDDDLFDSKNILMDYYINVSKKPTRTERLTLAERTGRTVDSLTCWFTKRRRRETSRREQLDNNSSSESDEEEEEQLNTDDEDIENEEVEDDRRRDGDEEMEVEESEGEEEQEEVMRRVRDDMENHELDILQNEDFDDYVLYHQRGDIQPEEQIDNNERVRIHNDYFDDYEPQHENDDPENQADSRHDAEEQDSEFDDSNESTATSEEEEEQEEEGYGEIEVDGIPSDEELDPNHLIQYGDSNDEDEEDEEMELEEQQEDLGRNVEDYMNNLLHVRFKDNDNESCGDGDNDPEQPPVERIDEEDVVGEEEMDDDEDEDENGFRSTARDFLTANFNLNNNMTYTEMREIASDCAIESWRVYKFYEDTRLAKGLANRQEGKLKKFLKPKDIEYLKEECNNNDDPCVENIQQWAFKIKIDGVTIFNWISANR